MAERVALVTGSGRGLGRGIACALAGAGWSVAVNYRNNEVEAARTVGLCRNRATGEAQRFTTIRADIADPAQRSSLVEEAWSWGGGIDALVNNAGVAPERRADMLEAGEESFRRLIGINLEGPYFLTRLVARRMIAAAKDAACVSDALQMPDGLRKPDVFRTSDVPRTPEALPVPATSRVSDAPQAKPGCAKSIVFITSISADLASVMRGEYCVSKAGLAMAVKLWAARLAPEGIGVFEVRPGIMETDMTASVRDTYDAAIASGLVPAARWGYPEDVGDVVASILQGNWSFATGSVIDVGGGLHIPRL